MKVTFSDIDGVRYILDISESDLFFGSVLVGTSSTPKTIEMTNEGWSDISLSHISLVGTGFSMEFSNPGILLPSQKVKVTVTFDPNQAGIATGGIYVGTAEAGSAIVRLYGSGFLSADGNSNVTGMPIFQLASELISDEALNYENDTYVFVINDPVVANIGFYKKDGAAGTGSYDGPLSPYTTMLSNASRDADDLGLIVNGAVDLNTVGIVPTRTGGNKKTVAKLEAEFQAKIDAQTVQEEIATAQAALAAGSAGDAEAAADDAVATVANTRLGAGEQAYLARIGNSYLNGASSVTRDIQGIGTGIAIGAASSGASSNVNVNWFIPANFASLYAGCEIEAEIVMQRVVGAFADKAVGALAMFTGYRDATADAFTGSVVESAAFDSNNRWRRRVKTALAANMDQLAVYFSISSLATAGADYQVKMQSATIRCVSVPVGSTFTTNDVGEALRELFGEPTPSLGSIFSDATWTQTLSGGATAITSGGEPVGATIPTGQTGANTNTVARFLLDTEMRAAFAGVGVGYFMLVEHSATFDRNLRMFVNTSAGTSLSLSNSRFVQLTSTLRLYEGRMVATGSLLAGTETYLEPFISLTSTQPGAAASEQFFRVQDVWLTIERTSRDIGRAAHASLIRDLRTVKNAVDQASVITSAEEVALLVIGQSNEQGSIPRTDYAAYPLAFESAIEPGVAVPLGSDIPVINRGGWWCSVHDRLLAQGVKLNIANAAVGGMSILTQLCGFVQTRGNNSNYAGRRSGIYPDRGDFGDIVQTGGKTFRVSTGRLRAAFSATPQANPVGSSGYMDFIANGSSVLSGSSAPDVTSTAVGDTVTDGAQSLVCMDVSRYSSEGTFYPGPQFPAVNGGVTNRNLGGLLGEFNAGFGFDPLGILARAWELLQKQPGKRRIVYFSQGQSDPQPVGPTTYQRAVMIALNFFLARGCEVMIGNTVYSPAAAGATTTSYGNQVTAVANAISELSTYYPGRVHAGANLYASMGSDGPMGGAHVTGSISGSVLTVSAVSADRGTGIAVGQRVWNGTALVGTVSSLGTGTGGTGTYNLTGAVTTSSTTLVCAGEWLQYDGVHINAAGAVGPDVSGRSCAAKYVADALAATLV